MSFVAHTYMYTWIYFLNAIEVAWENHCAWGVATDVPWARTEEQSRPVWRWAASSTPNYTLSCSVTLALPVIPGRSVGLQVGPVSPTGTSALGAVDDKTMHGVVMKLSMDWIFYKFQANNWTPQCVSVTNTVLGIQRYSINIYLLWTNHYFRHYKILKMNLFVYMGGTIFIFDWSYTLQRIPRGCRLNTPKV